MGIKKKSENQNIIDDIIEREGLKDQVESNRQTLLLLIHDDKFQQLVKQIRQKFDIPLKRGFRARTESLRIWAHNLDQEKWNSVIFDLLLEFPHLNENFIEHISLYVKFNSIYYGPILNYKTGLAQFNNQKRDWVIVTIYDLPDNKEWDRIESEVKDHFRRQGVERRHPIKNFDLKLKMMVRNPDLITGTINENGEVVKDVTLADRLVNKSGSREDESKSINMVRKYRERIIKEKKKRLG